MHACITLGTVAPSPATPMQRHTFILNHSRTPIHGIQVHGGCHTIMYCLLLYCLCLLGCLLLLYCLHRITSHIHIHRIKTGGSCSRAAGAIGVPNGRLVVVSFQQPLLLINKVLEPGHTNLLLTRAHGLALLLIELVQPWSTLMSKNLIWSWVRQ